MYLLGYGQDIFSFKRMRYLLCKDEIVVGRDKNNDINVAVGFLSKKQFRLTKLDDKWEINNLSVPLPQIVSMSLNLNDVISVGTDGICQFLFTDQENYLQIKESHGMHQQLPVTIRANTDELEDYLRCRICRELFINPVVTNCGHTFCQACIEQWALKTRYGGDSCPLCQEIITSTAFNYSVSDCVSSLLKHLPISATTEWNQLCETRTNKSQRKRKKKT